MEALRDDDLNLLYAAALAFGADWRRPVDQLAAEHLPNEPLPYREALSKAVVDSRSAVEAHIEHTHQRISGNWTKAEATLADAWIAERFPWMTPTNRRRARAQGQYYAWHDHG